MLDDFKLDRRGFADLLRSTEVGSAVHRVAEDIADNVRGEHGDADVVVDDYTTDRSASSVTIRDVRAKLWQVRDGVLTRAAARSGLEVTAR